MFRFAVTSLITEANAGDVYRLPNEFAQGSALDREVILETADLFAQPCNGAQQVGALGEESFDLVTAVLIELT